jgi:hypothetical protein
MGGPDSAQRGSDLTQGVRLCLYGSFGPYSEIWVVSTGVRRFLKEIRAY